MPELRFHSKYYVISRDFILPILIVLAIVAFVLLALKGNIFALNEIECRAGNQPCDNQSVISELGKYQGINLLTLETTVIKDKLLSGDYTIQKADITKIFPHKLQVVLELTEPAISVSVLGAKEWATLDKSFRVIRLVGEDPQVPTVYMRSNLELRQGQQISDITLRKALEIALTLSSSLPNFKFLTLEDNLISASLDNGQTALMTTDKPVESQIKALQAIIAGNTMTTDISTIDVRFDRPVLK